MYPDTREIKSISFGVYSSEEILNLSVCKIDSNKKIGPGSIYDLRMGAIDNSDKCETCHEDAEICPGHFGHIELHEDVLHPSFIKYIISYLKLFCKKCNKLLIVKDQIYLHGLNRYKGEIRFGKILEIIKKVNICCQLNEDGTMCGADQPDVKCNTDNIISLVYTDKTKTKTSIVLSAFDIKRIFDNISDEDIELAGFNPKMIHPRNFIISNLLVLPPCCRPFVKADGNICDDDLTIQYIEIIKANNYLSDTTLSEVSRQKHLQTIKFRIQTTFNNSKGKAKHTTNSRPIKCIKGRLTGKEGQIRTNIMGKRVNYSARTVIGPDPTLKMGQLGIPYEMCTILTIPERVSDFNIKYMNDIINSDKANFVVNSKGSYINLKRYRSGTKLIIGDIIVRGEKVKGSPKKGDIIISGKKIIEVNSGLEIVKKGEILIRNRKDIEVKSGNEQLQETDIIIRNKEVITNVKPQNRNYPLKVGDIVERHLKDGDIVLLNRQPTLHKGSMLAMEIIKKPFKTLRMNLAITKTFNADFDGDEMNIHVPQELESQAELRIISAVHCNMISPQAGKPNISIVQDSLLGAYKMTLGCQNITKSQFFNISMTLDEYSSGKKVLDRIEHIKNVQKEKKKKIQPYTGMGVVSLLFPTDFIYERKTDANSDEPVVKIYRGVMYEGTLNKTVLGASYNSIIQVLHKEYGTQIAARFVDGIQFVSNQWLLIKGFSVGIKDCLIPSSFDDNGISKEQEIADTIQKYFMEAEGVKSTTNHPGIREMRINAALGKGKDVGLRIAKNSLDKDNNFLSTVTSGSKGDLFNITQITGLLGQQNLSGARIKPQLNNESRTLPHYPYKGLTPEMEYESRGFISSSFIRGLGPREFYFHAMSGREGISDTAMGTATSGYMQRRIVKLTEDIKIQYDGTVRDATGRLYQSVYGDVGYDPSQTVKVNGKSEACDISRIVDKLNLEFS
jgi:DNA-directed RNA polymerase beta' subunit